MYRTEVGVYVFSLIQLAWVLLWLLCERSGCGHCALDVTNVVHMLVHVYLIVCYHVQSGSWSVCVFTNPIILGIVMASL